MNEPEGINRKGQIVSGTGEFKASPPEKYVYSNMLNIGVSATDITVDFGRIIVEKGEHGPINVGHGQIAVIMTKPTAKALRDTLDNILKSDPLENPNK